MIGRGVRAALLALAVGAPGPLLAAPATGSIDDAYYAGTEAFRAGELEAAIARFDSVRTRIGPEHALFAPIHYNLGRCAELMVQRSLPDPPVCEGVGWFDTFLAHADERRSEAALARAKTGKALLVERCAALQAPPPPAPEPTVVERVVPPPPADTTRWWLVGGAAGAAVIGGVALVLAADADANADAAFASYGDAETEAEGERWGELVREAESEAMTRSVVGLVALAGAVGLGVAALLRSDASAPAARVGPGALDLVWRF